MFLIIWENITKEIETIRLPVKDPKSERGVSMDNFPIIYPHRVLIYLFDHVGFDIPDEDVQAYWKHARQVGEPWAVGNPSGKLVSRGLWETLPVITMFQSDCTETQHGFGLSTSLRNM